MKQISYCIVIFFLATVAVPTIAQDMTVYGEKFNIVIPESLVSQAERDTLSELEIGQKEFSRRYLSLMSWPQAWSPDGKWIVFCAHWDRLWIIPAEGGVPEVLFEDISYEKEGDSIAGGPIYNMLVSMSGGSFTPDSNEFTFVNGHYDEDKGGIITVDGTRVSTSNRSYTIKSINIETREVRVLVDGREPSWSNNGRYLCYTIFDYRRYFDELPTENDGGLAVLDTETGETWALTDGSKSIIAARFTPDDSAIIFSMKTTDSGHSQFFRVPVTGGDIEQISFAQNDGEGTGNKRDTFDISPDGEWLVYTDLNFNDNYSFSKAEGSAFYSTYGPFVQLCFFNIASGEIYKLFPSPNKTNLKRASRGFYSPDGKKIMYMMQDKKNYSATNDLPLWICDVNPVSFQKIVMSDETVAVEDTPESFVLLSNYPNPFNPSTTITYSVPAGIDGHVSLNIYDIRGALIRTLVDESASTGVHSVVWDGIDNNFNTVSSGIYIYRLQADEYMKSNRMILVR